jgi:hypothetical protein
MRSGTGRITVLGTDNSPITTISTDPRYTGHPYVDLRIPDGCVCEIQGYTAALLYCHEMPNPASPAGEVKDINTSTLASPSALPTPELLVRIQITPSGKFSPPYHRDVMRPKVTTDEFFSWFRNEVNHTHRRPNSGSGSRGLRRLDQLVFTLKDAMPTPKAGTLNRGDEAHFSYTRKYIKQQYEKAKAFCPGLREFVILVTVPGTVETEEGTVETEAPDEGW